MHTEENLPMTEKENRNGNSDSAFGKNDRTSKCLKKKTESFHFFSLTGQSTNFNTICHAQ
jgi:hypothetical protein